MLHSLLLLLDDLTVQVNPISCDALAAEDLSCSDAVRISRGDVLHTEIGEHCCAVKARNGFMQVWMWKMGRDLVVLA